MMSLYIIRLVCKIKYKVFKTFLSIEFNKYYLRLSLYNIYIE